MGMTARPVPTRPIPERVVVVGCAGSWKTTLGREVAVRLDARHIERDALGDDEAPGFAALVAAAVEAAGGRWVFDGAPYNAEALVYPHADALVALDYPRRVVWRRVVSRSLRLWLTRRCDGAHTSTSPPWRWWAPTHPVHWAAPTHAARDAEIVREQVRRFMEQRAQIVDVLPAREYAEEPMPGAINLPLPRIEAEGSQVLDPSRLVVVYCADSA